MSSLNDIYNSHASLGRFGDTEMRMVDGIPSHVNPEEARTIDMYGAQGEKLVKSIGSGAINPNTGLPEYDPATFWAGVTAATAIGSWLVGSFAEGSQGAISEDKAIIQRDAAIDKKAAFTDAQTELDKVEKAGGEMMTERYLEERDVGRSRTRSQMKSSKPKATKLRTSANLAYGGTAEKAIQTERDTLVEALEKSEEAAYGTLQSKLAKFSVDIGGQRRTLAANISQEQANIDISERQAEAWYPWKNTIELFS